MAMDNRLDFIYDIEPSCIDDMTEIRKRFIELDAKLVDIAKKLEEKHKTAGVRSIALARTNIEASLMYAIKSLCILGEKE